MSIQPNSDSASEVPPHTPALARACEVETIERNGFKAVVFRLHGDGYFSECLEEMMGLAKRHKPQLNPDGTVSHFLLFDLEDLRLISDALIGVFLAGFGRKNSGLVPAVGFVRLSRYHHDVIELVRLSGLLPGFADEQAAFDAMTPVGFPSVISFIERGWGGGGRRHSGKIASNPRIEVGDASVCWIEKAAAYVFPDKTLPAMSTLYIVADGSSVRIEGNQFDLPNLEEIHVFGNASLPVFGDIAAKLVAPSLRIVEFLHIENVPFPEAVGLIKSHNISFLQCSILNGPFPKIEAEELHFSRTKVAGIPDEIQISTSLQEIMFDHCELRCLTPKVFALPKLEELWIPHEYAPTPELLVAEAEFKSRGGIITRDFPLTEECR